MRLICLLSVLGLGMTSCLACLWDSDTLRDELANAKGVEIYDLLTGQIPHHGTDYYGYRIYRIGGKIKAGSATAQDRIDLAVAHIRTGNYESGEKILKEDLAKNRKNYEMLSNLGVLEKKRGNFAKAADLIEDALEIKPEGHMGLGDWYVRMLRYRAQLDADPQLVPAENFLGVAYKSSFKPKPRGDRDLLYKEDSTYTKLANLLRNDQTFADGFVAMGDILAISGDFNLAYIAYVRAGELGHSNMAELQRRKVGIVNKWKTQKDSLTHTDVRAAIKAATDWLEEFQAAESELGKVKMDRVEFAEVEALLKKNEIVRSRSSQNPRRSRSVSR